MMQLVGLSISPYYERAALVVRLKGVPKEVVQLSATPFEMKSEEHLKHNPTGKIPVLILDDGSSLIESQVIAEYLNEILPGKSLMPSDPKQAARVRQICRLVDLYLAPLIRSFWSNPDISEDDRKKMVSKDLSEIWDWFEALSDGNGYMIGDDWTLADLALLPWFYHLENFVAPFGDWGVGERPRLINWCAHVGSSEVAKESAVRADKALKLLNSRRENAKKEDKND